MSTEDTTPASTAQIQRIELAGEHHALVLPDFIVRDELLTAFGEASAKPTPRQARVMCAMLGCCTRIGLRAGKSYADFDYHVLAYGGHVYNHLRGAGLSPQQMLDAGLAVLRWLVDHIGPRESEVAARTGFSGGGEEGSTAPPSA